MNTWDTVGLDARLAAAEGRRLAPAVFPTNACSPKLLRLPGEAGAPRTRIITRRPRPIAARVADVRALRRDGLISKAEARQLLGLEPLTIWGRLAELRGPARRALRVLRRVRWL